MKTAILSVLCFPLLSFAADQPRGSFKSSQFAEAREAAKAQGKALVYVETDSKTTCPKAEWGTKEVYKELKRDYILVVEDDSDPEHTRANEMNAAINETTKRVGKFTPRVTVVNPEDLKYITGTDYKNMVADKRWSKKMDTAVATVLPPKKKESSGLADKKTEEEKPKAETPRDWTNTDGKTIRATFVSRKADSVTLKLENGKTVDYPINKLSEQSKASLPAG